MERHSAKKASKSKQKRESALFDIGLSPYKCKIIEVLMAFEGGLNVSALQKNIWIKEMSKGLREDTFSYHLHGLEQLGVVVVSENNCIFTRIGKQIAKDLKEYRPTDVPKIKEVRKK